MNFKKPHLWGTSWNIAESLISIYFTSTETTKKPNTVIYIAVVRNILKPQALRFSYTLVNVKKIILEK